MLEDVKLYEPRVQGVSSDGKLLVDGGHLDKADTDGVEKTANALSQRWHAANKHLNERQHKWVESSSSSLHQTFLTVFLC